MIYTAVRCSCFGCDHPVVANGVCDMHYRRLRRHGHAEPTRAGDWGTRSRHPLYKYWQQIRRNGTPLNDAWHNDFWRFAADVGERPSERHMLFRPDKSQALGADNAIWSVSKAGDPFNAAHSATRLDRANYMREYNRQRRLADPLHEHRIGLLRAHGLTPEQYDDLLDRQGGKCAICGRGESRVATNAARPFRLSVDHKHGQTTVRGLLCSMCNHAIGYLDDSPRLLQRAIDYLNNPPAAALGLQHNGKHRVRRREREASPFDQGIGLCVEAGKK